MSPPLVFTADPTGDGGRQRDPRLVLRRRARSSTPSGRSRTGASWPPRAPTCSTSAASRRGPGAEAVSAEVELERVGPWSRRSRGRRAAIRSRSTPRRRAVAAAALDAGAAIVNDVTALRADPELAALCAERGCERRAHAHARRARARCRTTPATTTSSTTSAPSSPSGSRPRSPPGSTRSGSGSIPGSASARRSSTTSSCCGASASSRELGRPIVIGTSRKRFLGAITGREVGDRLGGTIASNVLALAAGADVFRVHDVAAARQALDAAAVILGRADWRRRRGRALALAPHGGPPTREPSRRSRSSCAASRSTPTTGSPTPSRRSASGW